MNHAEGEERNHKCHGPFGPLPDVCAHPHPRYRHGHGSRQPDQDVEAEERPEAVRQEPGSGEAGGLNDVGDDQSPFDWDMSQQEIEQESAERPPDEESHRYEAATR